MTKVTGKFAFELPFGITMKGSCGSRPHCITTGSEEIVVYAPAICAPPWSDEPVWSPEPKNLIGEANGEPVWEAKYIIIDIKRDFSTIPIQDADQKALVAKARKILHKILTLYRWRERQLQIDAKNIEQLNYRLRYYDAANNPVNAGPQGIQKTGAVHLTLHMLPPKVDKWTDICQDLDSGTMPELYESLLLDAYSIVSEEPRRAVLDAVTACEVFIKSFCDETSKSNPEIDPVVYSALTESGGLLYYFHQVLKYLFRHSLKEDKTGLYKQLDCLVRTNNSVKHEGLCGYNNDKGRFIEVDSGQAKGFIKAVEEAIQYTKSLGC